MPESNRIRVLDSKLMRRLAEISRNVVIGFMLILLLIVGPIWFIFFDDTDEEYRQGMRFCSSLDTAWLGNNGCELLGKCQMDCAIDLEKGNPSFLWVTYRIWGIPEMKECIGLIHAAWELAGRIPVRATLDDGFGLVVECSTEAMLARDE